MLISLRWLGLYAVPLHHNFRIECFEGFVHPNAYTVHEPMSFPPRNGYYRIRFEGFTEDSKTRNIVFKLVIVIGYHLEIIP